MVDMIIQCALVALMVGGIIPLVHFVYRYHRFSPWRSTAIGRTIMEQKVTMALILLITLSPVFAGSYSLHPYLTVGSFAVLVALFWRTSFELVKAQREYPHRDNWKDFWTRRKL